MRRAARVDENQAQVVGELRQHGVSVQHLHMVGQGCPDILCGWRGANYVFEIKDPAKSPSRRTLTKDETLWHMQWNGQAGVIHSADEAIDIMKNSSVDVPIIGEVAGDGRVLK